MSSGDLIRLPLPGPSPEIAAVGAAVVNATSDAVIAFDASGVVTYVNPAAQILLGAAGDTVRGRSFATIIAEESRAAVQAAIERYVRKGPPYLGPSRVELRTEGHSGGVELTPVRYTQDGRWCGALLLHDDQEREALTRLLEHEATHDQLTGLPNRGYLGDLVRQTIARAGRSGASVGVLFLDLDGFGDLNTARGHEVGDGVLAETARRLRRLVPASDAVVRVGGDEFVAVIESEDGAAAIRDLAHIVQVELERPFRVAGGTLRTSVCVGIAVADGGSLGPAELMHQADAALHRAKERGPSSLEAFEPKLTDGVRARHALEAAVKDEAFATRLSLAYQPLVNVATGEWAGAEALLRWLDADGGSVPPERLVATLERTGLIASVGAWALETACREAVAWRERPGQEELHVAVNLSVRQLEQPQIVEVVRDVLMRTGLAPRFLTLEVTESALSLDFAGMIGRLEALRQLGVSVAIDDFGTGYSSLAYLHRLPADILKIDKAFVQRMDGPEGDTAIVEAICSLASTIGLRIVAEGVETPAQARILESLGVDYFQGFLFARPTPSADVRRVLSKSPAALP